MSGLLSRQLAAHRRKWAAKAEDEPVDRRLVRRYLLPGSKVRILVDGQAFDLHLKDLSWRGLCGLTDAPVARGQIVLVDLAEGELQEAEIRWARTVVVGAVFAAALPDETMQRLWRRYQSRRARARR